MRPGPHDPPTTQLEDHVRILWSALLVGFAALTAYAFVAGDLAQVGDNLGRLGPWGVQLIADLLIALLVGVVWMWRDARQRGVSPMPYLVLTLATGSLGLLLYLGIHGGRSSPRAAAVVRGSA